MDNRLNEIRRKIKLLRTDMLERQDAIRDHIKRGQDYAESAYRLLAMRREMAVLIREWTVLGGCARLPTVDERLREITGLPPHRDR